MKKKFSFAAKSSTTILTLFLLSMIAIPSFAAEQFITAKDGGTIQIADGITFTVFPFSMTQDAWIAADLLFDGDEFMFYFGPDGTGFYGLTEEGQELIASYDEELAALKAEYDAKRAALETTLVSALVISTPSAVAPIAPNDSVDITKILSANSVQLTKLDLWYAEAVANIYKFAELVVTGKQNVRTYKNVILYCDDGVTIVKPIVEKDKLTWRIPHFSIYYFRCR